MYITFGTKGGKTVESLMIKEPKYIHWVLDQLYPRAPLADVNDYVMELIKIFDEKPFIDKFCEGRTCNQPATRFAVYQDNFGESWWCSTCDPYQYGASTGNLQMPNDYHHALLHVRAYCNDRVKDYRDLIGMIAKAKGLPNKGKSNIESFFDD